MAARRELGSPLTPALLLAGAALFFAHDPGQLVAPVARDRGARARGRPLRDAVAARRAHRARPARAPRGAGSPRSISWSAEPDRSWDYANRTLVYLAFALVGAFLGADPRRLLYGFSILLGAVCVWSLAREGAARGCTRTTAASPACAARSATGTRSRCSATSRCRSASASRRGCGGPGTLLVYGWIVVIGLTYSRGGVLVAVVVVALWMWLSHAWIESLSTLVAAGLPAAGALAVAFALPGLTSDGQTHDARVHAGIVFGVVLAVDALIAVGPLPLPASRGDGDTADRARRARRRDRRVGRGRRRARALVVAARSRSSSGHGADELARAPRLVRRQLPLVVVAAGVEGVRARAAQGHRRRQLRGARTCATGRRTSTRRSSRTTSRSSS